MNDQQVRFDQRTKEPPLLGLIPGPPAKCGPEEWQCLGTEDLAGFFDAIFHLADAVKGPYVRENLLAWWHPYVRKTVVLAW